MAEVVGKVVPGFVSAMIGIYVLTVYGKELDMSSVLISGLMFYWGISVAYYPFFDAVEELRDYLHKYSANKLGVEP